MVNTDEKCGTEMVDCPQAKKCRRDAPNWALLPAVVVHDVFDLLNKTDRQNAASACRNWRQNLFHPKWWRRVTFHINPWSLDKAAFLTTVFGRIASHVTIKMVSLHYKCTEEFLKLLEALAENCHLRELFIEPSHCRLEGVELDQVLRQLKLCLSRLDSFSIGALEELSHHFDQLLPLLASRQSQQVRLLGLASVKDIPDQYEMSHFQPSLIQPFVALEVLSIDFEQLSDAFLAALEPARKLQRLIIHFHGAHSGYVSTSNDAWALFKHHHPYCQLRLTVIHSYAEIGQLQHWLLRPEMPLTHFRVFFCEMFSVSLLEYLMEHHKNTLRSLVWVDSVSDTERSYALVIPQYAQSPDPLLLLAWQCGNLEQIVLYGYKYLEDNLIAIARLRGAKLKQLEVAKADILRADPADNFLAEVPKRMKRQWAPMDWNDLHPVICDPLAGDSDEYLLPFVLADLH